jgi:rRNA maturation RNase YbeY
MITYNFETLFNLNDSSTISDWIHKVISIEGFETGEINFIFCDDDYLLNLNVAFLDHDTLTDIISFDYTMGNLISGDVYISIPRVMENASIFNTSFQNELHRVIIHGILHYCGYKDKSEDEKLIMRGKEDEYLNVLII